MTWRGAVDDLHNVLLGTFGEQDADGSLKLFQWTAEGGTVEVPAIHTAGSFRDVDPGGSVEIQDVDPRVAFRVSEIEGAGLPDDGEVRVRRPAPDDALEYVVRQWHLDGQGLIHVFLSEVTE